MHFGSKIPNTTIKIHNITINFNYNHTFTKTSPKTYKQLILNILLNNPPLFPQHKKIKLS